MEELYFETIKCEDFEVFNLDYHNKRVADTTGLNLNLQEYINPISNELLRCKVIFNKSEIIDVEYFLYQKREIKSFKVVFDDSLDYSKKYLKRDKIDEIFSKKQECDEVIIVKNQIITDTSIANIAIFYNGVWITSKSCLLKGTTRDRLLYEKKIFKKDITIDMLKKASKIALMNAMIDFYIIEEPEIKF